MSRIFVLFATVFLSLAVLGGCAKKPAPDAAPQAAPAVAPAEQPASTSAATHPAPSAEVATPAVTLATDDGTRLESVFFGYDDYTLTASAREVLARNGRWLQDHPASRVTVEGHCDERGSDEYNLALGERRARAVKNYLVTLGVAADRLTTISYGEERPVDPGHGEAAWSKNRRVEFK